MIFRFSGTFQFREIVVLFLLHFLNFVDLLVLPKKGTQTKIEKIQEEHSLCTDCDCESIKFSKFESKMKMTMAHSCNVET